MKKEPTKSEVFNVRKVWEQFQYSDTFGLEVFVIWMSLFQIPEIILLCPLQENLFRYFFYTSGLVGLVSLFIDKIHWRYLHAQYFFVSSLSLSVLTLIRNYCHDDHAHVIFTSLGISMYLVWRIGSEKMHIKRKK